ncbi:MAG: PIN domain-containing protein [Gemmatimonadota bacterium]
MIVADTGAIVALVDQDDRHHQTLRGAFEADPGAWILPWAILPEVDHILASRLGSAVARSFRADVASGAWAVEWNGGSDVERARDLDAANADLELGLVDAVVMAVAERLGARAIATLDLRDFAAVTLRTDPELWPRDL